MSIILFATSEIIFFFPLVTKWAFFKAWSGKKIIIRFPFYVIKKIEKTKYKNFVLLIFFYNSFLQEKYLSEHNYDEPIDVDSTLKLLNFGDDYSKFIDSLSDEISDLDQNTVKPQRIKRKVRRSTVNIIDFLI